MTEEPKGGVTSAAALAALVAQIARMDSWADVCRQVWLEEGGQEGTCMTEEEFALQQQIDLDNLEGDHETLEALIEQARSLVGRPMHVTVLRIEIEDVDEWICLSREAAQSMIDVAFNEAFVDHVFFEGDAAFSREAYRKRWEEKHTIRIETRTLHDVAVPATEADGGAPEASGEASS